MPVSRRGFLRIPDSGAGAVSAEWLAARGREAWIGAQTPSRPEYSRSDVIRLSSNENPLGPGPSALTAIERAFTYAGRYPMNAKPAMADFRALVAQKNSVKPETVALGAGSGEILDAAVRAFTSPTRGLVTALPTYEAPGRVARRLGRPVIEIQVTADGKLDTEKMIAAAAGAGLVFISNPNNPTATVHSATTIADVVTRVRKASPDTMLLVDEAYHDYVTDPSYASVIPLVLEHPNLIVSRTMSKAHGMAGLRLGYGVGPTDVIRSLAQWTMPYNANALAVAAAFASLEDQAHVARERQRNTEVRARTVDFFRQAGFKPTDSQANFIWMDLHRPVSAFRDACLAQGVLVGREFPPFETHCRISIATMDEMQRAFDVFRPVLGSAPTSAASGERR